MKEPYLNPNQTPPALVWNAEDQVLDISKSAMLVSSAFSVIGTTRKDSSLKDKLLEDSDAHAESVNVTKSLFDKSELIRIRAIRTKARNYINDYTLPWGKSGERLLPAQMYNEFSERISELKTEWDSAVAQIIERYPIMMDSARERLAELFKEGDYPAHEAVEDLFSFEICYLPVPTENDFRVDLIGTASMEAIKGTIHDMVSKKVGEANTNIIRRMLEALNHLTEKIVDDKAIFRDVTVDRVREIADLAEKLNLTKDDQITGFCQDLRNLAKTTPADLRADKTKRAKTAAKAQEIAKNLKGVL